MLFSESAPPAAKPKVPATPFTLASTPPWEALVVRYPSPRSGRMKPPRCRCRVSGNWVVTILEWASARLAVQIGLREADHQPARRQRSLAGEGAVRRIDVERKCARLCSRCPCYNPPQPVRRLRGRAIPPTR